jgi:hypothetical protein
MSLNFQASRTIGGLRRVDFDRRSEALVANFRRLNLQLQAPEVGQYLLADSLFEHAMHTRCHAYLSDDVVRYESSDELELFWCDMPPEDDDVAVSF